MANFRLRNISLIRWLKMLIMGWRQQVKVIVVAQWWAALVPIVDAIASQPTADASALHSSSPRANSMNIIKQLGYDDEAGRQDKTLHPFINQFSTRARTTRVKRTWPNEGLFEALSYEMGRFYTSKASNTEFEATPLPWHVTKSMRATA